MKSKVPRRQKRVLAFGVLCLAASQLYNYLWKYNPDFLLNYIWRPLLGVPQYEQRFAPDRLRSHFLERFTRRALVFKLLPPLKDQHFSDPELEVNLARGVKVRNPLGLACGIQNDPRCCESLFDLGFGFANFGKLYSGESKGTRSSMFARSFEIERGVTVLENEEDLSLQSALFPMLSQQAKRRTPKTLLAACIGPTVMQQKTVPYLLDFDYQASFQAALQGGADLSVIDISGTPELRKLYYQEKRLRRLVERLEETRRSHLACLAFQDHARVMREEWANLASLEKPSSQLQLGDSKLILLKVDNDLTPKEAALIAQVVNSTSLDGVVVGGAKRIKVKYEDDPQQSEEQKRIAGKAIQGYSLASLLMIAQKLNSKKVLISSGGITRGSDLLVRTLCGAHISQVASVLSLRGPFWPQEMLKELKDLLKKNEVKSLQSVRGKGLRALKGMPGIDDESAEFGIFNV